MPAHISQQEILNIESFELANPPQGFVEDPFPFYDALLANAPVLQQPDGSVMLSRHSDLNSIYRDTRVL